MCCKLMLQLSMTVWLKRLFNLNE